MPVGRDDPDLAAEVRREASDHGEDARGPVQPVCEVVGGVVEALLLLACDDGLEARR